MRLGKLLIRWGSKPRRPDPFERLMVLMLETAVGMSARAIVFGVPAGVAWDADEQKRREDEAMVAGMAQMPAEMRLSAEDCALVGRISTLKCRNGSPNIPLWFQVGGEYVSAMPLPGPCYIYLLSRFGDMLVSLGGTEEVHQPMRYIELEGDAKTGRRRFVEVEMIFERDNTIRVELLG
jgi:hypothetical protein